MASSLTLEALMHLRSNRELRMRIEPFLDLKPEGMEAAITRGSKALTTHFAVVEIAKSMGVLPVEIVVVK